MTPRLGQSNSLILKEEAENDAAPFLFSDGELPEIDKGRPKFHCTGERLFRDRPDIYKAVVKLIAEPGVSIRTICRECHVSDHTVRSIAAREKIPIAQVKKEVLANITHGLRLASERVIELMPEASARDALIGVGILGEKMQLLGGDPTSHHEIKLDEGRNFVEQAARMLQQMRDEASARARAAKTIDAAIVDDTVATGLNRENVGTNGALELVESTCGVESDTEARERS